MMIFVSRYAFEAVEGDTVSTITPSEHDGGYSLNYEARSTAGNQSNSSEHTNKFREQNQCVKRAAPSNYEAHC